MLPSVQSRIIEQAKFTYASLGKALEKQNKSYWEQRKMFLYFFWYKSKINRFSVFKKIFKWRS